MKCLKMPFILEWKNQTSKNKFKKFHKANVENCKILQVCTIAAAAAAAAAAKSNRRGLNQKEIAIINKHCIS